MSDKVLILLDLERRQVITSHRYHTIKNLLDNKDYVIDGYVPRSTSTLLPDNKMFFTVEPDGVRYFPFIKEKMLVHNKPRLLKHKEIKKLVIEYAELFI